MYPELYFSGRASFRDGQSVTNGLVQHDKPLLLPETKRRLALASTANLIFCEALQKRGYFAEMEAITGSHHKYTESVPNRTRTSSIIIYGEVNSVKNTTINYG